MGENAPKKDLRCLTAGLIFVLIGIPGVIALEVPAVFDKMMVVIAVAAVTTLFLYVFFAWLFVAMGAYLVFVYVVNDMRAPSGNSPESAE